MPQPNTLSKLKVIIRSAEMLESDSKSSTEEVDEMKGIKNSCVLAGTKQSRIR